MLTIIMVVLAIISVLTGFFCLIAAVDSETESLVNVILMNVILLGSVADTFTYILVLLYPAGIDDGLNVNVGTEESNLAYKEVVLTLFARSPLFIWNVYALFGNVSDLLRYH